MDRDWVSVGMSISIHESSSPFIIKFASILQRINTKTRIYILFNGQLHLPKSSVENILIFACPIALISRIARQAQSRQLIPFSIVSNGSDFPTDDAAVFM